MKPHVRGNKVISDAEFDQAADSSEMIADVLTCSSVGLIESRFLVALLKVGFAWHLAPSKSEMNQRATDAARNIAMASAVSSTGDLLWAVFETNSLRHRPQRIIEST